MSDRVRPHRRQPTRFPHPWDSPGKNTGVGCHFLLQCMKVKSEMEVAQSCLTLCDPMDCSLPGSSVHGIFQARVLEWSAIAFSNFNLTKPQISVRSLFYRQEIADSQRHKITFPVSRLPLTLREMEHLAQCVLVTESCQTLCDPMDCSLPGSSVHGIFQARILPSVIISSSRGSSQPRD